MTAFESKVTDGKRKFVLTVAVKQTVWLIKH